MDSLGVEDAIKSTYSSAPEEFWFLNNGISLLIASECDLNMDVYDRVRFSMDNLHDISIINGAQTIKAVSEVCYSGGSESKSRDNGNPLVILRIYHYKVNENTENSNGSDLEAYKSFSEKVTISLNKQKPIRQSDLAYLSNFVKNIQNIRHSIDKNEDIANLTFDFVRQGEIQSTVLRQYQLDVFAKVVKSYLLKQPGSARTQSYNSLLATKMVNNLVKLNDKNIFKEQLQKDLERDKTKVFLKYYSPVNFAMRLKKYFETDSKFEEIIDDYIQDDKKRERDETKEGLKSFAKYGSLVMISSIINSINNFKDSFEGWRYTDFGNSNEKNIYCIKKLDELIKRILDCFVEFVNTTKEDITESNFWKKDLIIKYILEQMRDKYEDSHFNKG